MKAKDWGPHEVPHCEVESVTYPKDMSGPIRMTLTARGWREMRRRERLDREERRKESRRSRGLSGALWYGWLFGEPNIT